MVFSPNSSQILLVTAMYSVIGTLEELTANFGPFCRIDCSPLLSGLLDKFITHFFLMMSGTGVFLYLSCCCRWLNFLICQLFVILNTFSLDLYITSTISLKSLLLNLFLKLVLILFMWDSNFLIILLQYLTRLFRIDLWVLQMIFLFLECWELFDVQFHSFWNNILAQTSEIEM